MPFAPSIRKEILTALDKEIIPALWKQRVALGYVAPPLEFPDGIEAKLVSSKVPPRDNEFPSFLNNGYWPEAKLHSTFHAYLSCIYEGEAVERTLITKEQAVKYQTEQGIYSLQAASPSVLYFPAETPRNTGDRSFLEEDHLSQSTRVKIIQIALLDPVLVHTHVKTATRYEASHSLQITDPALLLLAALLEEEMHDTTKLHPSTAQAALLTFMLRLRQGLVASPVRLANTSFPPTVNVPSSTKREDMIYDKAIYFIQTHLHEKLSVSRIANELDISPTQLNRYFRKFVGTSTMDHVQKQRIEAAKNILIEGSENIEETALLLGYKYSTAFSAAFRKETGMSPREFRQKSAVKRS